MLTINDFRKPQEYLSPHQHVASFPCCIEWPTILTEEVRYHDTTAKYDFDIVPCQCTRTFVVPEGTKSNAAPVCEICKGLTFWYRYGCILDNFI